VDRSHCDTRWVRIAAAADIADERALRVEHDGIPVCLARSRGRLHAVVDRCTHQDVPLSEGEVEDGTIECYLHGSRFDLETGRALGPPAIKDVTIFSLRVDGDDVYVALPTGGR
jgi:3-phenylpropionate/trans-cinnamate dioxygenase ferredoxin subunit